MVGFRAVAQAQPSSWGVGERLTYDLSWGGLSAGTAVLEIAERQTIKERPALKILHRAQTNALVSAFYELDDSLQSLVDEQTLLPYKMLSERRVGIKREDTVVLFDQPARKATVTTNGRAENP